MTSRKTTTDSTSTADLVSDEPTSGPEPTTVSNDATPPPARHGDLVHFLCDGLAFADVGHFGTGVIGMRGMELTITEELLEANTDRLGKCFLHMLHDPAAQVARFGAVQFAPGPFPDDLVRTEPGTLEHDRPPPVPAPRPRPSRTPTSARRPSSSTASATRSSPRRGP